jgi:spermidine/putrescine transport system substrate-binding protein
VSEEREDQMSEMGAAFIRGMTMRRMSRRNLIRYAGMSVGTLGLSAILAACGEDGGPVGEPTGTETAVGGVDWSAAPGPEVNFSNWPLYIDKARVNGEVVYPSLQIFEQETGIHVDYNDEIQDNAGFFGKLQPQLQAGQDTGRDIIVITNGWEFTLLTQNGWVTELPADRRPNFDANAADWARSPAYDPGNKYSMAWQSGITGIGVNKDLLKGEVTSADDLMNPDIVGSNSVGILKGDAPDWVMINLGIDPTTSGPEEWQAAADWLTALKESGTVRQFYDQGYVDDLTAGNLAATMAWSGDVLYYVQWEGYTNLQFLVPEGGALLWIDNMLIPANSANPQGAIQLMDFVYRPEIAQLITEWVAYMSPVPAVQELIAEHAKTEKDEATADALAAMAESPLLWPDQDLLSRVKFARQLTTNEEKEAWDGIFLPIFES